MSRACVRADADRKLGRTMHATQCKLSLRRQARARIGHVLSRQSRRAMEHVVQRNWWKTYGPNVVRALQVETHQPPDGTHRYHQYVSSEALRVVLRQRPGHAIARHVCASSPRRLAP